MQNLLTPYMLSYFPNTGGKKLLKVLKAEEYIRGSGWVKKMCEDGKLELTIQRAEDNVNAAIDSGKLENQSYSFLYKVFKKSQ